MLARFPDYESRADNTNRNAPSSIDADVSNFPSNALGEMDEEPMLVIKPGSAWRLLDLRELWNSRELFYFLAWRDLKVRYKQTLLGVTWVIIQPLALTVVFWFLWSKVLKLSWGEVPYPVFAFAGLLPWTFFANSIAVSGNSIVSNSHIVTKVYFPRALIPAAAIGGKLVDFTISLGVLAAMLTLYRIKPTWGILMIVPLVLLLTVLSLAFGMWTSALNVKYRDVAIALPFVLQVWMFLSPTVYHSSLVPEKLQLIYWLNPMAGIIENFRAALLGLPFNPLALGISTAVTLGFFVYAAFFFRRMETQFAEIV